MVRRNSVMPLALKWRKEDHHSIITTRKIRVHEGTSWQIWIDTGGTFTDCLATAPSGDVRRLKILSSSVLRGAIIKHRPTVTAGINGVANPEKTFMPGLLFPHDWLIFSLHHQSPFIWSTASLN